MASRRSRRRRPSPTEQRRSRHPAGRALEGGPRPAARHVGEGPDQTGGGAPHLPGTLRVAGVPLVTAALVAGGGTAAQAGKTPTGAMTGAMTGGSSVLPGGLGLVATLTPGAVEATYTVRAGDTVTGIAGRTGIPARSIMTANALPASGTIRIGQRLVLPGMSVPATPRATTQKAAPAAGPAVHRVRSGETLAAIARRYRISPAAIVSANRIREPHLIRTGQRLRLPGGAAAQPAAKPASKPATKPAAAATRRYTIRPGDSLLGIAAAQKVDLSAVLRLNRLSRSSVIHPGRMLLLPGPPAATAVRRTAENTFLGRTHPEAVWRAARANRGALAKRQVPDRARMRAMVEQTARSMGVDPALALAVAHQESGFNHRAVSPANAIGTMQVIPGTGRWASGMVGRELDLLDPEDNVTAGVAVLAALLARADQDDAVAGYYQGLASVRSRGMYTDTKTYVASVTAHRKRFAQQLAG